MPVLSDTISLETRGNTQILDITGQVAAALRQSPLRNGLVNISVPGSTASLTTIEYESGVVEDLKQALERLAPRDIHYRHDTRWGDGNGFSHVRAALLGPSVSISFQEQNLVLGTWQQIVLIDFDNRPRSRKIHLQFIGE